MTVTDLITDEARFAMMGDEWNDLLADSASDNPFLTWEWLYTWWRHLREDRALRIVTVRDGERLIAIAPLALRPPRIRRLQPHRVLEFLGSGLVGSDYLDFIIRRGCEADAMTALDQHFADVGCVVELSRVKQGSRASMVAQRLKTDGWAVTEERIETCPYMDLAGHDWESYLQTLGSSHRYNVRRRFRKLESTFAVEFEECDSEPRRGACVEALIDLHHMRRETVGGSDALHTEELIAFHRELTGLALTRGWLRLYVLKLDTKPVASVYGFLYGQVFYFYQSGFDPDYNKFSVGLVVLGHSIQRAIEEGATEYDLLHGNEGYKFRWTQVERSLTRLNLYPPDRGGRLSLHLAGMKSAVKAWRDRFRPQEDNACRAA